MLKKNLIINQNNVDIMGLQGYFFLMLSEVRPDITSGPFCFRAQGFHTPNKVVALVLSFGEGDLIRFSELLALTSDSEKVSIYDRLASLAPRDQSRLLKHWPFWARPNQMAPAGDWTHWLVLAGRGFGKTRTGAEWVRAAVEQSKARRIALVAPTAADAREVMIEGESGLLSIARDGFLPVYEPSKRRVTWPNGAIATSYSADEPERLRGPQHDLAWCDELCAWRHADHAFDMLMFGLRLGLHPRTCITTTPKPISLLKSLLENPAVAVTRGTTYDNLDNLAPTFKTEILSRYEGTRLGRQELNAEILEDVPGALWTRGLINTQRNSAPSNLDRVLVAIDPPAVSSGDECGIVAAGRLGNSYYVLADHSEAGLSPRKWASKAVALYHHLGADRIVAEVNQGGDMVEAVIRSEDPDIAYQSVYATRGKSLRAEPIAALYEQGRVFHTDFFDQLEEQMVSFTTGFDRTAMGYSPDRVDALVWALTALSARSRTGRIVSV